MVRTKLDNLKQISYISLFMTQVVSQIIWIVLSKTQIL